MSEAVVREEVQVIEDRLLSVLIRDSEKLKDIDENIFRESKSKKIRDAIVSMQKNGIAVNVISLSERLTDRTNDKRWKGELERLANLSDVGDFDSCLFGLKKRRVLEELNKQYREAALQVTQNDNFDVLPSVGRAISDLHIFRKQNSFTFGEALSSAITGIEKSRSGSTEIVMPVNSPPIDKTWGGLFATDFIVIGGRPSMGKTTFGAWLAYQSGAPFGVISSEMQKEAFVLKYVSMNTGISTDRLRKGSDLTDQEMNRIKSYYLESDKREIYINDTGRMLISDIEAQAKEWVERYQIKVLLVDYVQLVAHDNPNMSKAQQVTDICQRLKIIAKSLGITVIGLAQINRESEKRGKSGGAKEPGLSDLKDSGGIEEAADIVTLLHRDSYMTSASNKESIIKLIIPKNRQGKVGFVEMIFDPQYQVYKPCSNIGNAASAGLPTPPKTSDEKDPINF